jgi:acyl-CoA dehydrogenase
MDAQDFADVLDAVRSFVREKVVPREDEIDATDSIPDDLRRAAADMGLFGYALPEAYGGLGLSMSEEVRLAFELGYASPAFRSMFGTSNGIAGQVIVKAGTDEQRRHWLPRLASGSAIGAFALTEAEAGSDPSTLTTKATKDGDEYVIDGSKRFITNAPEADVFMVFARTGGEGGRGISTFIVEAGTEGLRVGRPGWSAKRARASVPRWPPSHTDGCTSRPSVSASPSGSWTRPSRTRKRDDRAGSGSPTTS